MEKSITKNYFFNLIKGVSDVLFPMLIFTYTSRILGADGLGRINFSKAVISWFSMIAMLGVNRYGTREAAKIRDDKEKLSKFVQEILIINFTTTVFSYIMLLLVMNTVGVLHNYSVLIWINSISIGLMGMSMEWLYQALEEYGYIVKRTVLFRIIGFLSIFIFVKNRNDVIPYAIILVISSTGSYVLNFINARKYIDIKFFCRLKQCNLKQHMAPMLWLFAMAASSEINSILDSTMLGFMVGDTSVGLYNAAIKANNFAVAFITPLAAVLVPRLSYYIGKGEHKKYYELICNAYNYTLLISIPAAMGLYVLNNDIIRLFCGNEYQSAGFTMRIMACIVIAMPLSYLTNNQIFIPLEREKLIFASTGIGTIVNLICNSILIPRYAENGAAIGTAIAESTVAFICLICSIRVLDVKKAFKNCYQYCLAALPILIIAWLIKLMKFNYLLEMLLIIVLSVVFYIISLIGMHNKYLIKAMEIAISKIRKLS